MPIQTTRGPVEPANVTGPVLAHEHLVLDLCTDGDDKAKIKDGPMVADDLAEARQRHALGLVVDLTCRGMGRDVMAAAAIAERAEVALVVATGYYYDRFHPRGAMDGGAEAVAESLVTEIEHGIVGDDGTATGIKPGVLGEIGSHGRLPSAAERISLRAAGLAAVHTDVSVATHAHLGDGALEQLAILVDAGLSPSRISIGHQDLIDDANQHRAVARAGAFIAFDTVGKTAYQSDDLRVEMLLGLIDDGFAEHVLLSNDVSRDSYLAARGGPGFGHVLGPFRERLRQAGVDEATLDLLYRRNALRWLAGETV